MIVIIAPRLPVAPASMGSSSGFLPGGRTMVRLGLRGVRGPRGAGESMDSCVLSNANGSTCDQQMNSLLHNVR